VEDNLVNQEVAVGMLELLGCRIDVAENGRKALQLAIERSYNVIFMDCHMPEMDGFEATRRIRRHEREHGIDPVPVIALTADVLLEKTVNAEETGMNGFLHKPFSKSQLLRTLNTWVQLPIQTSLPSERREVAEEPEADAILDADSLDRLRALQRPGRPDVVVKVIGHYLAGAPDLVESIHTCIARNDGHGLREAAHSLKSSSANLGALRLADTCKELEILGSSERSRDALMLAQRLDGEYSQVSMELRRLVDRPIKHN
jgi:CheY-like chemotaxis protein/HPt (histidine-containing phosphotransfer) domain-containing protein